LRYFWTREQNLFGRGILLTHLIVLYVIITLVLHLDPWARQSCFWKRRSWILDMVVEVI
jgi:hypothetical protein